MTCPDCGKSLIRISDGHYHCICGVCMYGNIKLQWHKNKEITYCPGEWKSDPWIKTGSLS